SGRPGAPADEARNGTRAAAPQHEGTLRPGENREDGSSRPAADMRKASALQQALHRSPGEMARFLHGAPREPRAGAPPPRLIQETHCGRDTERSANREGFQLPEDSRPPAKPVAWVGSHHMAPSKVVGET